MLLGRKHYDDRCLVGAGPASPLFWDFITTDSFTILSASEDSRFLMGENDVVHCVQVSLTGTTMPLFWVH